MKVEIWMILIWVFGFVLVVAALCKDYQDRMERKRAENNPKAIQQEQEQSEENLIERREKILCYAIDEHLRKVLKGERALEIFLLAIYINMLAVNGGKWLALRNDLFYTISRKEGPQYSPVNHRSESPLILRHLGIENPSSKRHYRTSRILEMFLDVLTAKNA